MEGSSYPTTIYPDNAQRLVFLLPPLREMFSIVDRYLAKFDRVGEMDRPYFYNERATLSLFAGALWRCNPSNLVLEESCDEKVYTDGRYKGRFDIWFEAESRLCFAEAKQHWPSASAFDEDEANEIVNVLQGEADAVQMNVRSRIEKGWVHHALGIVFVTPYVTKGRKAKAKESITTFERILGQALLDFTSKGTYDVIRGSYLRQDLLEERWFASLGRGVKIYPGVDVLICERRRSTGSL